METLGNLESFVRAAQFRSFSEAARRMGVSAAAVSKNVARLESNLGTQLFQRNTRSLTLTEAGEAFYAQVGDSLETIQAAVAQVGDNRNVPAGRLRVNVAPSFAYDYLLPLLKPFKEKYPAVIPTGT